MRTFLIVMVLAVACFAGCWMSYVRREIPLAMEWDEGGFGRKYYGAKITLEPEPRGYAVRGIVYIDSESLGDVGRIHMCGIIGHAANLQEAADKFGVIVWKPDGLHVGPYFLDRETMRDHR